MSYPERLHHAVPGWVKVGAAFHIRVRAEKDHSLLGSDGSVARAILEAARFYHDKQRWHCRLMLVMPDHAHAILSFPSEDGMSDVIADWKSYLRRKHAVQWQEGYFDHRLRSATEADECWHYIRQNPLRAGIAPDETTWPWQWSPEA